MNENFYKNKNILIAGSSGFIGINLAITLKKMGANLRGTFLNHKPKLLENEIDLIKCDLTSSKECLRATKNMDYVFMCAANSSGALIMDRTPLVHLTPNIIMNSLMLEASYINKIKKFCFISSNTVYPLTDFPVKEENSNFDFFEKYHIVGWMKKFSEIMCSMYSEKIKDKMETIIIRPGNLYGPYDKFTWNESKVIAALIRRSVEKQNPFNVWGDGSDIKDFLYIDDFIDGMLQSFSYFQNHEVFNIASGVEINIKEIISKILSISNHNKVDVNFDSSKPTMIPKRLIDISKVLKNTNWKPTTTIDLGLKKTISWYKKFYSEKTPEEFYDNI